ncbi:acyl-CoA thioesterase [Sphingomonas donggukensis]|uniref:Acyl-CoA thioesterase n=1 Tax=Sphingomonas donggukensis TaxID=2949093 RepID=A0ABY4TVM4_9SPHN|nr:thioesterase family protein [Sphingomonas donggukensis]URW75925.1 acyl-CoA thioesterase [Sphingomonas donggukensis]
MTRPGFAFSTTFRVRYAEIDGQRVVFNSRYLEYADVAVTEFWPWTGIADALGTAWTDTEFHVRRTEIDYLKPFVFGDMIEANIRIERVGTSSLTQYFELAHADTGDLHCTIAMVIVNVDLASGRAVPIGDAVRAYLATIPGG